ncbi:hypothetical protein WMZ97_19850 [Lentibacillus sp. N15]|uniref:hypothetical protein n=1 Tax=Lentibacillus songyuanensis TaxID=3136161 RepID=UPI0031BB5F7A
MKRFILLLLLTTSFASVHTTQLSAASQSEDQQTILIASYQEDVTGDGQKEEIELKGIRFSQDSMYFHNVWADIKGPQTKQWKIVYEGGYEPSLQFNDLNHNGINDVIFQSAKNESKEMYQYQFNTLRDEQLEKIKVPESYTITGKFKPNFKAALFLDPSKDPIIIDMEHHAAKHIQQGIYNKDGKLMEQTHLVVDSITHLEPAFISKSKGFGLKSQQQVSGMTRQDKLGTIEALWYFESGKWIKLKQEWKPSQSMK